MVYVVLSLLALPLVIPFGPLTWMLAVVAALLAATYPFFKRFFAIPQAYLGIAFGFGIPMSFAAVRGELPANCWILLAANIAWAIAYDTEYAMVDREDDLRAGSKSTAILFGDADLVALGILYGGFFAAMWLLGQRAGLGINYWVGLAVAAGFSAWQFAIARDRRPENCFRAFLANQWVGLAVFAGIALEMAIAPSRLG